MIFPRLLALAERAWHRADWEDSNNEGQRDEDWERFANTLGYKELARLDKLGIDYRISIPGARWDLRPFNANDACDAGVKYFVCR